MECTRHPWPPSRGGANRAEQEGKENRNAAEDRLAQFATLGLAFLFFDALLGDRAKRAQFFGREINGVVTIIIRASWAMWVLPSATIIAPIDHAAL